KPDHLVVRNAVIDAKARRAGEDVTPDYGAELRNSRTRFYRLLPPYDRRLAGDEGADVDGGALASSARTRYDHDGGYRPAPLPEWLAPRQHIPPLRARPEKGAGGAANGRPRVPARAG